MIETNDEVIDERPPYSLHAPDNMINALGGLLLGPGILIAINYWRTGRKWAAPICVIVGALASLFLLNIDVPLLFYGGFGLSLWLVLPHLTRWLQGGALDRHEALGGDYVPWWPSVVLSVVLFPFVIAGATAFSFVFDPPRVAFGPEQHVYYDDGATEEDARRLGEFLQLRGIFTDEQPSDVLIERSTVGFDVSFIVKEDALEREEFVDLFRILAESIADMLEADIRLHLTDKRFEPRHTIEVKSTTAPR